MAANGSQRQRETENLRMTVSPVAILGAERGTRRLHRENLRRMRRDHRQSETGAKLAQKLGRLLVS
jgi:hypothetical protein